MPDTLKVWTDGGARGNPGPAGIGVVIKNSVGNEIYQFSGYIGNTTNNVAEYQAVLQAVQWLAKWQSSQKPDTLPAQIDIYMDSQLVAKQLSGEFKIKNNALKNLAIKIFQSTKTFSMPVLYHYVPRHQNKAADALVNQALDAYMGY